MSELQKAISETIEDQHPVSDFIVKDIAAESEGAEGVPQQKPNEATPAPTKRKAGRPKGSTKKKPAKQKSRVWTGEGEAAVSAPAEEPEARAEAEAVSRAAAAAGATQVIQISGMMLAGEDGKMAAQEFSSVQQSFDAYFLSKGISDFPPGIALGLSLGGYYIRVISTEAAKPRVYALGVWIKHKLGGLFKKKQKPLQAEKENSQA